MLKFLKQPTTGSLGTVAVRLDRSATVTGHVPVDGGKDEDESQDSGIGNLVGTQIDNKQENDHHHNH